MARRLADTFQEIVDSLPDDWTDLEIDLRLADEDRYVDAATYLITCNALPYSHHDWHFRLLVAMEAGARGHQVAQNHVLLEADQVIHLAGQGRLGQHLGRFLEAGS